MTLRVSVNIVSPEISGTDLRVSIPRWQHLYAVPFLPFYPLLAYAYYIKYDDWIKSEEWTFLACVLLGAGHALSFLVTRWSAKARAWITTRKVCVPITFSFASQSPTVTSGSLSRRGGLHSHPPSSSSRTGRNRSSRQTRPLRSFHVLVQLSTRCIRCYFRRAYYFWPTPLPVVHAPSSL